MNTTASIPRLMVSGLSGGGGKTLAALGLVRAFTRRGLTVKPCKKGPDYIDSAWLGLASGLTPTNLDPYFLSEARLLALFSHVTAGADMALIEGNRGLYDGRDLEGSCSTAALARTLNAPILLILTVTKMTRTAAAIIAGLASFEPVSLAGVMLNRVGSSRHAALIRRSIETYTGIPVIGELPRLTVNPIPERHMGLVSMHDEGTASCGNEKLLQALDNLADLLEKHADVDAALAIARSASPLVVAQPFWEERPEELIGGPLSPAPPHSHAESATPPLQDSPAHAPDRVSSEESGRQHPVPTLPSAVKAPVSIGYVRDAALWFYYEENLEALRRAGARLVELSILSPEPWPCDELNGLYLGGGFPEMVPERIAASPHLEELRALSRAECPIYAECGGFMILCREIRIDGRDYPMAGLFPARAEFYLRPQGLGYVEATVERENPFHPRGSVLRGHEFHYSCCVPLGELEPTLSLSPGVGMSGPGHRARGLAAPLPADVSPEQAVWSQKLQGRDGLLVRRTFAAYTHLFAPAVPHWAERFVASCRN